MFYNEFRSLLISSVIEVISESPLAVVYPFMQVFKYAQPTIALLII